MSHRYYQHTPHYRNEISKDGHAYNEHDGRPYADLAGGRQYDRINTPEEDLPEAEYPSLLDEVDPYCKACKQHESRCDCFNE